MRVLFPPRAKWRGIGRIGDNAVHEALKMQRKQERGFAAERRAFKEEKKTPRPQSDKRLPCPFL